LFIALPLLCAGYELNKSYNIRFGMPSKNGALFNKSGFILLHSTKKRVPLWVSYNLKKEHLENNIKMMRKYAPEPKLGKKYRAELSDYKKRGMYDRARMVPLQDMLRSAECMKEAHYLSNVCPMHHGLNRKAWRELEKAIREFVRNKTQVWVMAGPVYKDLDGDGSPDNLGFLGRNKVEIPTHFFKIVVYQAKDNSFHAVGFLFRNRPCRKHPSHYTASIDEIEEYTGMDFLHLLPDEAETIIERRKPGKGDIEYLLGGYE